MEHKKRLDHFDIARGIGACLVILGHMQYEVGVSVRIWIFSFHMPLFFLISGMLARYRRDPEQDLRLLARRRARGIMLPYLSFSILYMLTVFYAFFTGNILINSVAENLWYCVSLYGIAVLWFLPALYFGEMIFLLLVKKLGRVARYAIPLLSAAAFYLSALLNNRGFAAIGRQLDPAVCAGQLAVVLVRFFICMSFIALGYALYPFFERFARFSLGSVLMLAAFLAVNLVTGRWNLSVDMRSLAFSNPVLYLISAVSGSLALLFLCRLLAPFPLFSFFRYLGKNSLVIMAVHGSIILHFVAEYIAMHINLFIRRGKDYVYAFVVFSVILLYSLAVAAVINRFFPFIAGKKKRLLS